MGRRNKQHRLARRTAELTLTPDASPEARRMLQAMERGALSEPYLRRVARRQSRGINLLEIHEEERADAKAKLLARFGKDRGHE